MSERGEFVTAYVERYRDMFPVRFASIAGISVAAWLLLSPWWGLQFAGVQFALYAVYLKVVGDARRAPETPDALKTLSRSTEVLSGLLALHVAAFVFMVWLSRPNLLPACLLLIVGNLMVGALQVHVSKLGFAAAVTPPSIALIVICIRAAPNDRGLFWCVLLFVAAVIGACWRQQVTDRQTVLLGVERAMAAERLRAALEIAEAERVRSDEANRAKSKFLAMISHEIRTPLNVVLGLADVLHRQIPAGPHRILVSEIREAGGMLLRLLNAVLDLSKIESGHAEAEPAPVDLGEMMLAIGRIWRLRVEEAGLRLVIDVEGDPCWFRVVTDGPKIEQTLVNLLSNALKLTPMGEIRLRAVAEPASEGAARLRFEVHDEGPGVAEEERRRIFEPFEQLAAGRNAGGAGLGLSIAKANIECVGGRIGVDPREGRGAVFWFELTAPTAEKLPEPPAEPDEGPERPLSVLVAEDHPANQKLLVLLLEQFGLTPTVVGNGQEALDACAAANFDLVLMDVMMPVLDGLEALKRLRATEAGGRRTLVYMLTANVFEEDLASYRQGGADGVLKKPIEIASLHAVLQSAAATG